MSGRKADFLKAIFFFCMALVAIGAKKLGMVPLNASWHPVAVIVLMLIGILYLRQALRK